MPGAFPSQDRGSAENSPTKSQIEENQPTTSLESTVGESSCEQDAIKNPVEVGFQSIAAFFGMPLDSTAQHSIDQAEESSSLGSTVIEQRSPIKASSPIKVGRSLYGNNRVETNSTTHDSDQEGEYTNFVDAANSPAEDFVDADGHIWRSRFCLLEEGVLYFYRNSQDANSAIAIEERQNVQAQPEQNGIRLYSPKDLSKSPVSKGMHGQSGSASTEEANSFTWEKRVFLNSVGSVRSAEQEFGANAFQLEAISGDQNVEKTDTLVLCARNEDDMKEWIFQFHRSLSWFMRSFMKSEIYMDIAYPITSHQAASFIPFHRSDKDVQRCFAPSPILSEEVEKKGSLSHGHGRIGLQRSRQLTTKSMSLDNEAASDSIASIPRTGLTSKQDQKTNSTSNGDGKSSKARAYIPPHLRRKMQASQNLADTNGLTYHTDESDVTDFPAEKEAKDSKHTGALREKVHGGTASSLKNGPKSTETPEPAIYHKGGCADPQLVPVSIVDSRYIPRKASRLGPNAGTPFGCFGGEGIYETSRSTAPICWETGAVSECGIRDSNEDAYLISNDLLHDQNYEQTSETNRAKTNLGSHEKVGLFAIFDGHQGDQAARFAAEKLGGFILEEIENSYQKQAMTVPSLDSPRLELTARNAMARLDREFCSLCHEGGREWESGATALVAILVDKSLVVANLGDCRGVICRGVVDAESYLTDDAWHDVDFPSSNNGMGDGLRIDTTRFFWRGITNVHSPSVETERERIEEANGWVTTETEIPIGQLRRIDFRDEDVVNILKRGFSEAEENLSSGVGKQSKAAPQRILEIFRVCGDLSVSRSIGDRDFKAEYNPPRTNPHKDDPSSQCWEGPLYLKYPDDHNGRFKGDLVSCVPDFQRIEVGEEGVNNEFLLLASDGLWDVLDADDAIRVTRELLVRKKIDAKQAAARLAELAIHLGSSDNVTVIILIVKK
ncbi:unnamed protein product [Cylindrotheca closterium]|uniref:protein-serine/threonine phosphatase n=1 Tax=Cylindrotheca closterium TaxID=2856 RepID=A0AAD2GD05_9STRA|nr:unnamed protein product [Cylindrotheca closterium]